MRGDLLVVATTKSITDLVPDAVGAFGRQPLPNAEGVVQGLLESHAGWSPPEQMEELGKESPDFQWVNLKALAIPPADPQPPEECSEIRACGKRNGHE